MYTRNLAHHIAVDRGYIQKTKKVYASLLRRSTFRKKQERRERLICIGAALLQIRGHPQQCGYSNVAHSYLQQCSTYAMHLQQYRQQYDERDSVYTYQSYYILVTIAMWHIVHLQHYIYSNTSIAMCCASIAMWHIVILCMSILF